MPSTPDFNSSTPGRVVRDHVPAAPTPDHSSPPPSRILPDAQEIRVPVKFDISTACRVDFSWGVVVVQKELRVGRGEFDLTGPLAERVRNGLAVNVEVHPKLYGMADYTKSAIFNTEIKALYSIGSVIQIRQSAVPYAQHGPVRAADPGWSASLARQ